MTIKLANNVTGFLNTAITASDTGIVLQSGNGASFPALGAGEYFYATLVSTGGTLEVVKVTARSGDSMTVVRAQDGSSAASFAAGSRVEMRINAQAVRDAIGDVVASQVGFTPTGGIAATDVQAALAEVDTEKVAFTRLDDSDGSSLVGFLQAGTGAQARTVQSKLRETVSVKDFGAVGDGVADDTAAVQAAVNAAAASNSVVYAPGGTYLCANISVTASIVGEGTFKLVAAATTPLFVLAASNAVIEGITLDGNRANQTATLSNDIAGKATIALLTNITVASDTPTYNTITNYRCRGVTFQNSLQSAIIVKADTDFQEVSGCRFTKIVQPVWYVVAVSDTATPQQQLNAVFTDNDVYDCGETISGTEWGDAVIIGRSSKVLISNNRFRQCLRDALYFDAISDLVISGNIFDRISWNAIQFQPTALTLNETFNGGLLISNNVFRQIGLAATNNVAISFTGSTTATGRTFVYGPVQVVDNVFHDPFNAAVTIAIQVLSHKYRGVLIDSNDIRSHLYGVQINTGSNDQGPSDVTVSNNVISSVNSIGVYLTGTNFITGANRARIAITQNKIFDSGAQGIWVQADIARQLYITGNIVQGGAQEAIRINSGASIDGGLIYGNYGDGRQIISNLAGVQWGDNYSTSVSFTAGTEFAPRYAVGTFDATLTTSGTDFTSVTYTNRSCRYVRIGALVHIQGRITTSAVTIGSANGNIAIGNLPFTPAGSSAGGNGRSAINIGYTSGWGTNAPSHGFLNDATGKIVLYYHATANGVSQATNASTGNDVSTTSNDLMFSLSYYTSN